MTYVCKMTARVPWLRALGRATCQRNSPIRPLLCYTYPSCDSEKSVMSTQLPIPALNLSKGKRRTRIRPVSALCVRHGWKRISASCVAPHAAIICLVRIIIELAFEAASPMAPGNVLIGSSACNPTKRRSNRGTQNQRARSGWHRCGGA